MPELPETETIARDLDRALRGAVVTEVVTHKADVLREVRPDALATALVGRAVAHVWRRAKLVVLDLADGMIDFEDVGAPEVRWHLVVQPRFTGGLLVDHGGTPPEELRYAAVTLRLADGRAVHYRDVRRLGTVALMSRSRFEAYTKTLGPEPLDPALGEAEFSVLLRSSRVGIKQWLMDQRRLAGIGNIYANEALWRAGIDPSREAASLTIAESTSLLHELRETLHASIEARGTTFRDYRDAHGGRGNFVEQLRAYGRAGEPCARCGRRLVGTHAVDGRSTVFCAFCQR